MKNRLIFYIVVTILLLVAAVYFFRAHEQQSRGGESSIKKSETKASRKDEQVTNAPPSASTAGHSPLTEEERRESINKWESHRESLVEFWGKVIDQNGQPVEGAKIKSSVTSYKIPLPGIPLAEMPYYIGVSDVEGNFHIKSDYGRGFTIESIDKEGYILPQNKFGRSENLYHYNYDNAQNDRFRPDPNNPIVFKLWKLAGPEPLVPFDKDLRIPHDGSPVYFDLMKGSIVPNGGDFFLKVLSPSVERGTKNYNWNVIIGAVDGGLIESNDPFMYLAPESGYIPQWLSTFDGSSTNWTPNLDQNFYLKSQNGAHYSRLHIAIYSDSDIPGKGIGITVKSFLNPQGSRNLEFDPELTVTPARIEQIGLEAVIQEVKANKGK